MKKVKRRGYRPEAIVAVDDTPRKWEQSYGNLVRVRPLMGDVSDDESPQLWRYLNLLRQVDDVRRFDKRNWRSRDLQRHRDSYSP